MTLADIVTTLLDRGDVTKHPGVFLPSGRLGPAAPPLTALDAVPRPDFDDFPWDRYPERVLPLMTGRGCS